MSDIRPRTIRGLEDIVSRSSNNQMTPKASLSAAFLCMLFGCNAVAIKFSLAGVGAFTAAGLRFGISAFLFFLWAAFKKQVLLLFILSQFFIMQSIFLYLGLTKTTASHGVLITNLLPFFVMVLAHFFIPGDHITLKNVLGLIFGFLGIILLFFDNKQLSHDLRTGDLMILFTAFFWGCNIIYAKRIINDFNVIQITW